MKRWRALALAGLVGGLAACSTDRPKPTPLEPVAPKIAGRQVWAQKLDSVQFPLQVAVRDGRFIVAGTDGTVLALDAASGKQVWRGQVDARLAAGVGSDGRFAAVVTRNNELVVLDAGRLVWKAALDSATTAAPLVAGEPVFVMGVDRLVHAFDVLDGRRLWTLRRPGEALTLSQPGVLMPFRNTLVVGQGAVLTGVDSLNGQVRWEASLANPRGTNEVERLADLVAPALRVGEVICARAFQAAVACANAQTGRTLWTRNVGGTQGLGGDAQWVVGADASDRITGWRAASGETGWTNEKLLNRSLTAPLAAGRAVVFGDLEGQLHFLAIDSGEALLRLSTDGSAIAAAPVASGTTMLAVTRNGGLYAFRPD